MSLQIEIHVFGRILFTLKHQKSLKDAPLGVNSYNQDLKFLGESSRQGFTQESDLRVLDRFSANQTVKPTEQ